MSYNKTLLYSGNRNVSSCKLSESSDNFKRLMIDGIITVEIPSFTNKSNQIILSNWVSWESDIYIFKLARLSIDSTGTYLSVDGYNIIGSQRNVPTYWGNGINSADNRTIIREVYGVDRINYIEEPGIGSPGTGWRRYNEILLWSGANTDIINLSESASNFERLRLKLGVPSSSNTFIEVDAPLADGYILTTTTGDTESPSIYRLAWSNWIWSNNCKTLTAVNGKSFRNSDLGSNTFTSSLDNSDTDLNKRPILEIVGINRLKAHT